ELLIRYKHHLMIQVKDLFLSPPMSDALHTLGVTGDTLAQYRQFANGDFVIVCEGFDMLGLYSDYPAAITGYSSSFREFPAYALQELVACIPGFFLER